MVRAAAHYCNIGDILSCYQILDCALSNHAGYLMRWVHPAAAVFAIVLRLHDGLSPRQRVAVSLQPSRVEHAEPLAQLLARQPYLVIHLAHLGHAPLHLRDDFSSQ